MAAVAQLEEHLSRREAGYPYAYSWGPRGNLPGAMVRGGMNSALIEFPDGYLAVVSRKALRHFKGGL